MTLNHFVDSITILHGNVETDQMRWFSPSTGGGVVVGFLVIE